MKKTSISILALSGALLLPISTNSYSEESRISGKAAAADKVKYKVMSEDNRERIANKMEENADKVRETAEMKADRMEDKADMVRKVAEKKADRMEDNADRKREYGENKADRMEERADKIREVTVTRY